MGLVIANRRGIRLVLRRAGMVWIAGLLLSLLRAGTAHAETTIAVPCTGRGGGTAGLLEALKIASMQCATVELSRSCVFVLEQSQIMANAVSGRQCRGGGIYSLGTVQLEMSSVTANHPDNCAPQGSVPGCNSP